jgi:hypothetical protein
MKSIIFISSMERREGGRKKPIPYPGLVNHG